jgi:hypothetical protein
VAVIPAPIDAILDAIRSWPCLAELASFAKGRHGFGNSDGGFGVIYPGDLDAYDRSVAGAAILEGHVQVYGFWGPPDGYEINVPERLYLEALAGELSQMGRTAEAELQDSRLQLLVGRHRTCLRSAYRTAETPATTRGTPVARK